MQHSKKKNLFYSLKNKVSLSLKKIRFCTIELGVKVKANLYLNDKYLESLKEFLRFRRIAGCWLFAELCFQPA